MNDNSFNLFGSTEDEDGFDDLNTTDINLDDFTNDQTGSGFIDDSVDMSLVPQPDLSNIDTDFDDVPDMTVTGTDTNGDGIFDAQQMEFLQDIDGDGYNETLVTGMDINSDGIMDLWTSQTDSNLDGIVDVYGEHSLLDTDGDGISETMDDQYDSDLDGYMEVRSVTMDTDGNGIYDHQEMLTDTDGDHILDNYNAMNYVDNNNDGIIDAVLYDQDNLNDGLADGPYENIDPSVGYGSNYDQNFDPSDADINWDDISGDPSGDMENWHMQTHEDTCAVVCQEYILKENGIQVSEDELREMAMENGWYSEGGGTPADHVGDILEAYGMDVNKTTGASIDDIQECLNSGGSAIVGVDGDEIWAYSHSFVKDELLNDSPFAPGGDANHAVEVIGIDSSDPDNVMVILNDPGSPGGCGSMIPLDDFMSAWDDSNNMLVTADK